MSRHLFGAGVGLDRAIGRTRTTFRLLIALEHMRMRQLQIHKARTRDVVALLPLRDRGRLNSKNFCDGRSSTQARDDVGDIDFRFHGAILGAPNLRVKASLTPRELGLPT